MDPTKPTPAKGAPRKKPVAGIVRHRPLHEAAVDRLRDMIVEGELGVGERLHDANLADILQVSRTPIREAIKVLATEGLVELLPGRGARVAELSPESLGELFEVIAGLERYACELAAERMTPRERDKLQRMHERMAAYHAAGERRAYFRLNHEIHLGIVALAKNAVLAGAHAALIAKARRGRHAALDAAGRWVEAMAEHEALMQALAERDGRRAGEIMLEHDRHTGQALAALLAATTGKAEGVAEGATSANAPGVRDAAALADQFAASDG